MQWRRDSLGNRSLRKSEKEMGKCEFVDWLLFVRRW
jgi:hypothetical protein